MCLPAVVWCLHCVSAAQEVQACELVCSLLATPLETWRSMVDVTAYFPIVLIATEPTCSLPQTLDQTKSKDWGFIPFWLDLYGDRGLSDQTWRFATGQH